MAMRKKPSAIAMALKRERRRSERLGEMFQWVRNKWFRDGRRMRQSSIMNPERSETNMVAVDMDTW